MNNINVIQKLSVNGRIINVNLRNVLNIQNLIVKHIHGSVNGIIIHATI